MTATRQTSAEAAASTRPAGATECAAQAGDDEPGRQRGALSIDLIVDDDAFDGDGHTLSDLDETALEAEVLRAAGALAAQPGLFEDPAEAAVRIAGNDAVRALNAAYRGQDKPTNVLSFPVPEGIAGEPHGARFLGDIIIAAGVLEAEAADRGIPAIHHLQHLVIHGLLHLLGHDHERGREDADRMEAIEIATLAQLSVPNPYDGEVLDV